MEEEKKMNGYQSSSMHQKALATPKPSIQSLLSRQQQNPKSPSIRSKFLSGTLSMASRQSPRNGRALSSMSGTYRGLSVNDHFRSNSRLKQTADAGPGIRARAFNNTGLYSGVSSKGTSAVKPPLLRNSRMENSSATKSI